MRKNEIRFGGNLVTRGTTEWVFEGGDSPACPRAMSTPPLTRRSSADPPPSATAMAVGDLLLLPGCQRVVRGWRKILVPSPLAEVPCSRSENARHLGWDAR